MLLRLLPLLMLACVSGYAETNAVSSRGGPPAAPAAISVQQAQAARLAQRAEQLRTQCIEGRRYIAGRVLHVLPEGLVVDSGFSRLLSPPFNRSWVVSGTASVSRDASAVEERKPDAVCIGPVLLTNIPKRPAVKTYDYVVIHGYPAGDYVYSPVPGIQKTIRRFSASLERAVQINLERESK